MKTKIQTLTLLSTTLVSLVVQPDTLAPVDSTIDQVVEQTVVETVEDTVSDQTTDSASQLVEETVMGTVEETVSESVGQGVDSVISETVDDTISKTVEDSVGDTLSSTLEQETVKAITEDVESTIGSVLENPMTPNGDTVAGLSASMPAKIPVKGRSGETVFYEVAVENHWRAVQSEWLLVVDEAGLDQLEAPDIEILERVKLKSLGLELVRIRVSDGIDSYQSLHKRFPGIGNDSLDRNHIYNYRVQSGEQPDSINPQAGITRKSPVCEKKVKVGVIDTAVKSKLPAFRGSEIMQRNFLDRRIGKSYAHGTAIAGLLVAKETGVQSAIPNASLAVASVVYLREDGSQGATVVSLLRALDWLGAEDVGVINMSIVGPPNVFLEKAVSKLVEQGTVIVAAVGNEGPLAPPLYPAAYPGVLGVTAVDGDNNIYRWANRGDHVDFSARGVSVKTISSTGVVTLESGTSMAAPVVSAFTACEAHAAADGVNSGRILSALGKISLDLGETGRDRVFGLGLLD